MALRRGFWIAASKTDVSCGGLTSWYVAPPGYSRVAHINIDQTSPGNRPIQIKPSMNIQRTINVQNHSYPVEVPDACLICHRHSEIHSINADSVDNGTSVQAIFRCAYAGCRQFFFCYYGPNTSGTLLSVRPIKPSLASFPVSVHTLSPTFVTVFAEAEEAGQLDLKQIAGPGYRKAFEFLIKDYAKSLSPGREAEIEAKFAGAVVSDFIADARIQAVAKRSLWLGNDETHYTRRWTDYDVSDLVTLIKLTANWIEIDHLSKSYVQTMPDPKGA